MKKEKKECENQLALIQQNKDCIQKRFYGAGMANDNAEDFANVILKEEEEAKQKKS